MPVGQGADLSIAIDQMLKNAVGSKSEVCIFKVHNVLRNINAKAYEPQIIAIGPYHRNKSHLEMMEKHKLEFLHSLLQRRKESVSKYVSAMKLLEEKARRCYAEATDHLSPDEFVKMMVVDGCFIIELLVKFTVLKCSQKNNDPLQKVEMDPLFRMEWIMSFLQRDLMLFENQLPFFVLSKLYEMIDPSGHQRIFIQKALEFFNDLFPGYGKNSRIEASQDNNIKHLLDLIHRNWSSLKLEPKADFTCNMENLKCIGSSTELAEAGIRFEKIDDEVSFDIVFQDGLLQIPVITIEDRTECFLRNLIAYEQHCWDTHFNIVIDYMTFLGCLIKSVEDVKKLSRHGILRSFVGDNEAVCKMFSTMNNCIVGPSSNFHYAHLFNKVNSHCDRRLNKWMASFRRKYMHSPWGVISILAASTLLLLALLQVIFQIVAWKYPIAAT
ncbi:OLC1v1019024C1 [Oldenlandia corymbosa var. corymbosa]|uniref:OLC1v1019024C1 n=1 Tax=Oldenlandia corymbosa var. corymbosa TaxID=529605 RepID=A0AAV1ED29_OLDCO|nr:OLC1v1019024C1 [Oldenlandia corymbosa var. corymbosa]